MQLHLNFKSLLPYGSILGMVLSLSVQAQLCTFELPPNEQIVLKGNADSERVLHCEIAQKGSGTEPLINFVSEKKTSTINNLVMPEGTIMSLSYSSVLNDAFTFKLVPQAKLGITNDTAEAIRLKCNQFSKLQSSQ